VPPEAEPSIHMLFPQARIERLEAASHWVHAEQPQAFLALVAPFLAGD
jgi:esterase